MKAKKRLLIFILVSSLLLISLPSHSSILNYDLWTIANFPRWEIQRILWKVRWLNKSDNGQSEGIHSTHTLFIIYMSGCISFIKDRGQQQLASKSSCEKTLQISKNLLKKPTGTFRGKELLKNWPGLEWRDFHTMLSRNLGQNDKKIKDKLPCGLERFFTVDQIKTVSRIWCL